MKSFTPRALVVAIAAVHAQSLLAAETSQPFSLGEIQISAPQDEKLATGSTVVELKDIRPPADIVNAMGRQMKAEREKRANILEAEGLKSSEILRAEGQKQSQILEAEGRREAAFRDAEAREREAEAEAKATQMVSDAIAAGNPQALNYFIAQKYTDAVQQFATSPNAKTILFPVEATQLIGTLGGIGELVKDALSDGTKKG